MLQWIVLVPTFGFLAYNGNYSQLSDKQGKQCYEHLRNQLFLQWHAHLYEHAIIKKIANIFTGFTQAQGLCMESIIFRCKVFTILFRESYCDVHYPPLSPVLVRKRLYSSHFCDIIYPLKPWWIKQMLRWVIK